jgi:hypothetical protein
MVNEDKKGEMEEEANRKNREWGKLRKDKKPKTPPWGVLGLKRISILIESGKLI